MFKKLVEFVKGLFGCSEGQKKAEAAIALAKQKREEMMKQRPTTPPQPYRPTVNVEIVVNGPKVKDVHKEDFEVDFPIYAKNRVLPPKAKNKFRQEAIRRRRAETRNNAVSQSDSPHIDPITTGVLGYNMGLMDDSSSSSRSSSSSSSCSRSDSDYSYSSSSSSSYDSSSSDSGSSSSSCD